MPVLKCDLLTLFIAATGILACPVASAEAADLAKRISQGQKLFVAHCAICHQVTGKGTPGVYPPLAASDYLQVDSRKERIVHAIAGGLKGKIAVNGKSYDNQMPAVVLDDAQAADVATFVLNSWKNPGGEVTAQEVGQFRRDTDFKTFGDLVKANAYEPLPSAPQGFELKETFRLTDFATRLASDGQGKKLYVLGQGGAVWRLDLGTHLIKKLFSAEDYADVTRGDPGALGFMWDAKNRLWITINQRNNDSQPLVTNEVTIFRTTTVSPDGDPSFVAITLQ